jgi:hypothetical protein
MRRVFLIIMAFVMSLIFSTAEVWAVKEENTASTLKELKATVAALQAQVTNLQTVNTNLQSQVRTLESIVVNLQDQVTSMNMAGSLNELSKYVTVQTGTINDLAGPHVIFTGANVHIRSGSGYTNDNIYNGETLTGLGNLIVGYNEGAASRTGSHNLVIGPLHSYTLYGGFVAGYLNTISGAGSSVSGGYGNDASGDCSSVSGGVYNTASGHYSSVSGGISNEASGYISSVSGGSDNTASTAYSYAPYP